MAYLIGIDEAGYGPNLGPLVIAGTVWRVPTIQRDYELYETLSELIQRTLIRHARRIVIADSKQIYRPRGDWTELERGVLTPLGIMRDNSPVRATSFRQLCRLLHDSATPNLDSLPWYRSYDATIPCVCQPPLPDSATHRRWQQVFDRQGVQLTAMKAVLVFPHEFNEGIARFGSKGALLSHRTLDLVCDLIDTLKPEPVRIVCDKHGGRNRYGMLLQSRFGEHSVRVRAEGRQLSRYELSNQPQPTSICFQMAAESFLPSALASMMAKYVRELCMVALNGFWRRYVPNLRPTAGYPLDAKRFKQAIASAQRELGIDDNLLWRVR